MRLLFVIRTELCCSKIVVYDALNKFLAPVFDNALQVRGKGRCQSKKMEKCYESLVE